MLLTILGQVGIVVKELEINSKWYTTNDATLEITGVQLEVGSVATDFEHRSFGDELAKCCRYFQFLGRTIDCLMEVVKHQVL